MSDNRITKVLLTLSARKLKNVAGVGKGTSDPYAVVCLLGHSATERPNVLGQTEVLKNNLNPSWTKTFEIDYEFGKLTRVNIGVYDEIRKAKTNKPMGSAIFEVGEVLGSRGNVKAKKLKGGGTLFLRVEKAPEQQAGTFHLQLRGIKMKNVDGLLGKSDPFFELSRRISLPGGHPSWQVVYRSKHILNDLNPKWEPVSIGLNELCDGDQNQPVLVSVFDWEKKGAKHKKMGNAFETTVNGLINARTNGGTGDPKTIDKSKAFRLTRKGIFYGFIVVTTATISGAPSTSTTTKSTPTASAARVSTNTTPFSMALNAPAPSTSAAVAAAPFLPPPMAPPAFKPKFVDYLSGGCELQLSVAIDFTGSNGDPRKPGTLHYIHRDGQLNDYEKALTAVGSIIARYDSDQQFPVLGFGAKYHGVINHCFQLGPTPEAQGIAGVLQAYRGTFKTGLIMSGPTVFAECINLVAAQARSKQMASMKIGQQSYHILLILTDGAVTDVNATKQAIKAASDGPLSIVIVGIGSADFTAMQFLDDFHSQEAQGGRDICQFVEFERHKNNRMCLTQATLDEIPEQLVNYFYSKGIKPLPEITGSKVDVVADEYDEDVDIDLTVEFNEDGEINLADEAGVGYYDDTGYGDYNTYAGVAVMPPPTAPHSDPPAPYNPSTSATAAPYQALGAPPTTYAPPNGTPLPAFSLLNQPQQQPYNPSHSQHAPQTVQAQPYTPGQPVQATPFTAPRVFYVQVPHGVSPGQQIQAQNPTGQPVIITVPPGFPGGSLPVSY